MIEYWVTREGFLPGDVKVKGRKLYERFCVFAGDGRVSYTEFRRELMRLKFRVVSGVVWGNKRVLNAPKVEM